MGTNDNQAIDPLQITEEQEPSSETGSKRCAQVLRVSSLELTALSRN